MPDTAFYLHVKTIHHTSIALSLLLFTARWLGVLARAHWPLKRPVRMARRAVLTDLLTAGVGLWVQGGCRPWLSPWLGTKLGLLVVYVLLGSWALKRAHTPAGHALEGVLALATAAQMVGVAIHHHPSGWVWGWLGRGHP
mgnify:CR=1 FL=1